MVDTYIENTILIFMAFVLILLVIYGFYLNVIRPFTEVREYIKMEMQRSDGKEYFYWKKELKKLYMHYIPFIGLFIK